MDWRTVGVMGWFPRRRGDRPWGEAQALRFLEVPPQARG